MPRRTARSRATSPTARSRRCTPGAATTRASRSTRPAPSSRSSATKPTTRRRCRRIASTTGRRGDAAATELASASTPGMPKGMVRQRIRRAAVLEGRRAALSRHRRAARGAARSRTTRRRTPAKVDLWNYKDPLIQPMQKVRDRAGARAQLPRRRPSRRQALRAARDARTAERERRRRSRAAARHLRHGLSPGDLLGPGLQRRLPPRSQDRQAEEGARALGQRRDACRPAASTCCYFDERNGHWLTYRVADGARVEPDREDRRASSSRRTTRRTCPAPTASAAGPRTTSRSCSTTSSTSGK